MLTSLKYFFSFYDLSNYDLWSEREMFSSLLLNLNFNNLITENANHSDWNIGIKNAIKSKQSFGQAQYPIYAY